ncbi:MAG: transferrin receptor-like dimerization domain-containing protein, partial [Planctomycetota bacterium]|nr:transferrin receptor-like dimerization domain-containing protein [Planctomycetota bacterium]
LPFGVDEPVREAAGALESMLADLAPLDAEGRAAELLALMRAQERRARKIETVLDAAARESATGEGRGRINAALRSLERAWLVEGGMPGRPWFQNRFTAPDETSGYASWSLPEIRAALLRQDAALVASGLAGLDASLTLHDLGVMDILDALQSAGVPAGAPAVGRGK